MNFRIGQKVVCVDASGLSEGILKEKEIYTIDGFLDDPITGRTYIFLVGLEELCPCCGNRQSFLPERFRPLVERKTSIELFKRMLTGDKVDA